MTKRKNMFIADIKPATTMTTEYFQVAALERRTTKRGDPYIAFTLQDRTGQIEAKLWGIPAGFDIEPGDYVAMTFEPSSYNGELQLRILSIHRLSPAEVALDDYLPASQRDRHEMYAELLKVIGTVTSDELRSALWMCMDEYENLLRDAPAAKKKHHAYLGGLLEHILSLCALIDAVARHYPVLNRDVLIAAAVLHDIGKIRELAFDNQIKYSRTGALTGHIILGSILWSRYSGFLDAATRDHIQHIIASHHGRREWGAAQVPMTREAHVFHLLDMIDARVALIGNLLAAGVDADGMTPYNHALECAIWNGD